MDWVSDKIKDGFTGFFKWIGLGIANGVINNSYYICLFVCMTALFLYIAGIKKAGKYVPASFIIYYILQCFKLVLPK